MEYLLAIGLAMFAGLFLSRLTSRFNLPDVTSYLVAGLLIGPLGLGALGIPHLGLPSYEFVEKLGLISDVSLGFIAFSIGNEFRLEELKHIGRQATVVAIFQALSATIFVDVGLLVLHLFLGDTLPSAAVIRNNQQVVTSGSTVYPRGLIVGSVVDAGFETTGVAKYALLQAAADIDSLEQVFIITQYTTDTDSLTITPTTSDDGTGETTAATDGTTP